MSFSGIIRTDVLVIGGGAAGLAAVAAAADVGVRVTLVESERLGGILCRCIHDGFGLTAYGESLTGPEYASREIAKLEGRRNVDIIIGTVTSLSSALSAEVVSEGFFIPFILLPFQIHCRNLLLIDIIVSDTSITQLNHMICHMTDCLIMSGCRGSGPVETEGCVIEMVDAFFLEVPKG